MLRMMISLLLIVLMVRIGLPSIPQQNVEKFSKPQAIAGESAPEPEKEKKKFPWLIVVTIIAIIVGIGYVAACKSPSNPTTTTTTIPPDVFVPTYEVMYERMSPVIAPGAREVSTIYFWNSTLSPHLASTNLSQIETGKFVGTIDLPDKTTDYYALLLDPKIASGIRIPTTGWKLSMRIRGTTEWVVLTCVEDCPSFVMGAVSDGDKVARFRLNNNAITNPCE